VRYKLNSYIHFEAILSVFVLKRFNGTNVFPVRYELNSYVHLQAILSVPLRPSKF
jgi:hypothetical protein